MRSGRGRTLYLSIRRAIKQTEMIIGRITFANYVQNFIHHPAEEIIGDHQCGFRCNRSTADHTLCIRQILEIK